MVDFKKVLYSIVLFLVFSICSLQAQTAFEKLPDVKTLSSTALKQIENQKKTGLGITDTPSAIFINNYSGKNSLLSSKFEKLEKEIFKFIGFQEPVSALFPIMTTSSVAIGFKNLDSEFVLDSVQAPECGVILSNGKDAPIIIRGLKDSYLPQFKEFFGVTTTEAFQKLVKRFEKKRDRKSNQLFEKDFKNAVNDINENDVEHISFPKDDVYAANENILKALFREQNIFADYQNLKNTKQVYIEYTKGGWKGRNYTFEFDKQQRIVSFQRRLYNNIQIDTYKMKYFADGLIKKIDHIDERTDLKSKSSETILIKTPDSLTIRVLVLPRTRPKGTGEIISTELNNIYSYEFYYDNLYQLKEMKWLIGNRGINNTQYFYDENKNLIKKIWTVIGDNEPQFFVATENFGYNQKNERISRDYNHAQKGSEPTKGGYIISAKGESEVGKGSELTFIYSYDKKGRKVLETQKNKKNPYKMKFIYEDF